MIFCISPGALREPLPGRPHGSAASGRKALPQSAARRCKTPPPAVVNPPTRVSKPPSIPQNEAAVKGHSERHAGLQISVLVQNIASHADGTPPPPRPRQAGGLRPRDARDYRDHRELLRKEPRAGLGLPQDTQKQRRWGTTSTQATVSVHPTPRNSQNKNTDQPNTLPRPFPRSPSETWEG